MRRLFSYGAILFRRERGKILFLLLDHGTHWGFPKGLAESDESMEETVRREVEEETGITRLKFLGFKKRISWVFKEKGKVVGKDATFVLAETKEKKIKLSGEHVGFRWCAFEEALRLVKFKNAKEMLEEAHIFLEGKVKIKENVKALFGSVQCSKPTKQLLKEARKELKSKYCL